MKRIITLLLALALCLGTAAMAEEAGLLGTPFPDFTATDSEGNAFTLSEALKDHEAALVNIWATWCGPCEFEVPFLQEAYEAYSDRVAFICLSREEEDTAEVIEAYRRDHGLTLPMGRDEGLALYEYIAAHGEGSIPATVIVDRFGNVGFMGYPVVASIFGHEAVFYAAVLNVVNTFAVFTIGTVLVTGSSEVEGSRFQKKVLYSTPMLAAYLTMAIVALEIDNIPAFVSQPLTMLGNITVPAALLIIGSSMSQLSLRTMLGNRTVYLTTLFRLVLLPVAVYYLTSLMGFSDFVVNINTLVIAMPVATYGTILCLKYGRDTTVITEVTFITTLLSMLTIPLLVTFLM